MPPRVCPVCHSTVGRKAHGDNATIESTARLKEATQEFLANVSTLDGPALALELEKMSSLCKAHVKFGQDKVALATWTHAMVFLPGDAILF
jgi:hypothetical protein